MPNRLIREGFLDSEAVQSLSDWAERVFHRLLIAADDAGRADGRAEMLRARLLPLDCSRRSRDVVEALHQISEAKLVKLYEVGGKPYVQVTKWQRCSQSKLSKFPAPDGSFEITFASVQTRDGAKDFVASSIVPGAEGGLTGGRPMPVKRVRGPDGIGIPSGRGPDGIGLETPAQRTETETETETETVPPLPSVAAPQGGPPARGAPRKFTPPTLDEVRAEVAARSLPVDPEAFLAHYQANGWVQGRGKPVRDWCACLTTWAKNEPKFSGNGNGGKPRFSSNPSAGTIYDPGEADRLRAEEAMRRFPEAYR